MGDHKAWNGTAWVRPRFWDGSGWLVYIPPVYDVPYLTPTFDANNEGWEQSPDYPADWSAGAIYSTTPGGLLSTASLGAPDLGYSPVPIEPGVQVKARYRWRSERLGTADQPITLYFHPPSLYGTASGSEQVNFPTSTQGEQTYTTTGSYVTPADPAADQKPGLKVTLNDANLNGGNETRLWLLEASLINAATGQPLMELGNSPWEPYARTNDGRWV